MAYIMKWFATRMRAFAAREEGTTTIIVGFSILALIAATGTAMDVGRAHLVQSKLSSSLDAAGLAGGSTVSTVNLEAEVTKYLNANFQGYMGSTITDLQVVPNGDNSVITLSATATLPTTLMQVLGHDTMTVAAASEITRESRGLELVLVLDNTGSMNCPVSGYCASTSTEQPNSKLSALKGAANDMLDILYGDNATVEDLWIGVVPFSQAVNIGSTRTSWVTADAFNWYTTSWGGCVDAREASNRDTTDDPPSTATFPRYYWPDDGNNNWITTTSDSDSTYICHNNSNCRCSNYGPCGTTTSGNVSTTIACSGSGSGRDCTRTVTTTTTNYIIDATHGPNKSCPQQVTPMTAAKATVESAINAMTARGNTHIVLGAAWGWRMQSPRWRGLWGGEMDANDLPLNYNTDLMNKAVIIMTDGDNTIDNNNHGAYWYLNNNKLGTTNQATAEAQLDTRLGTVCTNMKNNNIIVYTISFGSISASSQTMLRNCASQADYYFNSPDNASLQTAFRAIGDSLANLRVSK